MIENHNFKTNNEGEEEKMTPAERLLADRHVGDPSGFDINKPPAERTLIDGYDGNQYRFFKCQESPTKTVAHLLQNGAREDQVVLYCDGKAQGGTFEAVRVSELEERLNRMNPDFRRSPMGSRMFLLLEDSDA